MFRSPDLPYGQQWHIDRMAPFGYQINRRGMCYGISSMAMQAILANDLDTFNKRLAFINQFTPNELYIKVSEAKKKEIAFILQAKLDLLNEFGVAVTNSVNALSTDETDNLNKEIDTVLLSLDKENNNRFHAQLNLKKNEHLRHLSEEEHLILSVEPYFQSVSIYQDPWFYSEIFDDAVRQNPINQMAMNVVPLLLPSEVERAGNIKQAENFCGIYTKDELIAYFSLLRKTLDEANVSQPVSLLLGNYNHAITVGYDPAEKTWIFVDPNRPPSQILKKDDVVSAHVMDAFSGHHTVSFSTEIFVAQQTDGITPEMTAIKHWLSLEKIKEIHTVTESRAQLRDPYFGSWLYTAVRQGDHSLVEALLEKGADANETAENGQKPFSLAAQLGDNTMLALLLSHVNVDEQNDNGVTPLFLAILRDNLDTYHYLLKQKANPDLAKKDGTTPLLLATEGNNLNAVAILLQYGADANRGRHADNVTPLHQAAKLGNKKIAYELLIKGMVNMDVNMASISTSTLLQYADSHGHKADLVDLINSKRGYLDWHFPNALPDVTELHMAIFYGQSDIVSMLLDFGADYTKTTYHISPLELAKAMGHDNIVQMIELRILSTLAITLPPFSRRAAIQKFNETSVLHAHDRAALQKEYRIFKELDELAQNLTAIAHEFHSSTPKKSERLLGYIKEAYDRYAKGDHDTRVIEQLKNEAHTMSVKAQQSFEKGGGFLKFFSEKRSHLADSIDEAIETTNKKYQI